MNYKPLSAGEPLIEVERDRYDDLLRMEQRLALLENALKGQSDYANIAEIKRIFGLNNEVSENEQ